MENSSKKPTLLPFPWPYKSALAISSDIDDCSPQIFADIHTFLNTDEATPLGQGLGLEISDSAWAWSHNDGLVSLLDDNDSPRNYIKKLASLCHQGWIDAFHAFGDFNNTDGFSRKRAARVYEILKDLGISLETFINHGNRQNHQNFSCRLADSYLGDDPDSPFYHGDLSLEYGIKFYWWDEVVATPLSASNISINSKLKLYSDSHLKNLVKSFTGKSSNIRSKESLKELMVPYKLKDGNSLWAFTRYNNYPGDVWARPGRHTFKHQLNSSFLDKLVKEEGYAVIYTHFGQPEWEAGQPLLDETNLAALRELKQQYQQKNILVTATGRLLNYWLKNRHLVWEFQRDPEVNRIIVKGIADPVFGFKELSASELKGLAFKCESGSNIKVFAGDDECHGWETHQQDGFMIVSFPWSSLEPPSDGFRLVE